MTLTPMSVRYGVVKSTDHVLLDNLGVHILHSPYAVVEFRLLKRRRLN
jgi:hypothetical protein